MITIKRGLDVPLAGRPDSAVDASRSVRHVALVADDYVGMKPTMAVQTGQQVATGELLFTDKKVHGVRYTAPGSGCVVEINRGEKRRFRSMVIELDGEDTQVPLDQYVDHSVADLSREQVRDHLVESGLWTAFRTRPFSKIASPATTPHSIFVTAMESEPLAPPAQTIIEQQRDQFSLGLHALGRLTDGKVYVCTARGADVPGDAMPFTSMQQFDGPHPAGLPGTHIHFLDPVGGHKTVWHIGYQDVIAIGTLFHSGRLSMDRIVSLGGPGVAKPRLLKTRIGASIGELLDGELVEGQLRVISGSALSGRAIGDKVGYLGRYHRQICVLHEGTQRVLLGWHRPGMDKFSLTRTFLSAVFGGQRTFPMTTSTEGSRRSMVPIGTYEKVMPLDIVATYLLRAIITRDTEQAQALGCLELDEEDLALCTFVCPAKYDYGPMLRDNLTTIEEEG